MTAAIVRTALGDVAPGSLGRVDYHDHLFQVTPLLPGDELDDEALSGLEAAMLKDSGIDGMVDATPTGLGRNPEAAARISARTGLAVVLTSGAHRLAHYGDDHWLADLTVDELKIRFVSDLSDALPRRDESGAREPAISPAGTPIRAGMLKLGIGYWDIGLFENRVAEAVAAAHTETGAPVTVHLEYCSAAFEVLALLSASGVRPDRVVLAHADRNPDPGLHRELALAGAYLGYDGMARHREWPDSSLIDLIAEVAAWAPDRILLGGDVARRSRYVAYGGIPGLSYLPIRFVPRLEAAVGGELVDTILVANPRRLLTWA